MTTSSTSRNHLYYNAAMKKSPLEMAKFLEDGRMENQSLGECLDFISRGHLNYVSFVYGAQGLVKFIENWMQQNPLYMVWNREPLKEYPKLPYIDRKECPSCEGLGETVKTRGGVVRCANKRTIYLKEGWFEEESFYDWDSQTERISFIDLEPEEPQIEEDTEESARERMYLKYCREREEYDDAREIRVSDVCWRILSDKDTSLPLEKILGRLSVHDNGFSCYPFSGFDLADYVELWHKQPEKLLYTPEHRGDNFRVFPNFVPLSSDD